MFTKPKFKKGAKVELKSSSEPAVHTIESVHYDSGENMYFIPGLGFVFEKEIHESKRTKKTRKG